MFLSMFFGIVSLILNLILISWNMLQTITFNEHTILWGVFAIISATVGLALGISKLKAINNEKNKTEILVGIVLCTFNLLLTVFWISIVIII